MPPAVIFAAHLEAPLTSFFVQFTHCAYCPDEVPLCFPSTERVVEVLAETPGGALAIAKYHYHRYGSAFHLIVPTLALRQQAHRPVMANAVRESIGRVELFSFSQSAKG